MEREEAVQLLLSDVTAFNERRRASPRDPLDLSGVSLAGAKLQRVNLADANLRGATLLGADLAGALLSGADLQGADMRGATVGGFVGDGRICLHPNCFENTLYDRAHLEEILEVLNRNGTWQITYQITPKE